MGFLIKLARRWKWTHKVKSLLPAVVIAHFKNMCHNNPPLSLLPIVLFLFIFTNNNNDNNVDYTMIFCVFCVVYIFLIVPISHAFVLGFNIPFCHLTWLVMSCSNNNTIFPNAFYATWRNTYQPSYWCIHSVHCVTHNKKVSQKIRHNQNSELNSILLIMKKK